MTLCIDFGSSRTKMVLLQPGAQFISEPLAYFCYNSHGDENELLEGIDDFISIHGFSYFQIGHIFITGIKLNTIKGTIHKIPVTTVDEIAALAFGGLAVSGLDKALILNLGTGTTFIYADKTQHEYRHIGGTSLGGGTLTALLSLIFPDKSFDELMELSAKGNYDNVDLCVQDLGDIDCDTLPPTLTATNLGKLSTPGITPDKFAKEDIVAGIVHLVLQSIGSMSVFADKTVNDVPIVLTGGLSKLPLTAKSFQIFIDFYKRKLIIPEDSTYATAIGAALVNRK